MSVGEATFRQERLKADVLLIHTGRMLDNNNAHQMVDQIAAAQTAGFKYIILECTDLEFLSSAGVGSILGTIEVSRSAGGDIILANPSGTIRHVLKVLDLVDFLTLQPDYHQAVIACSGS